MYYIAYEEKNTKQKRCKVFGNKQEVFEYFKKIMPKQIPDSNELTELDEAIGARKRPGRENLYHTHSAFISEVDIYKKGQWPFR